MTVYSHAPSFFVKLDKTTSIPINDAVLIPLKADITKLFGTNKIEFQISIKDNKIILESPSFRNPDLLNEIEQPGAVIV